ncbi:MAG TPA: TonB-dependent receptor [Vicinamibacterales bacterium]|nr:TonB-dependent receptor [Vicinamibacterales bacterium]
MRLARVCGWVFLSAVLSPALVAAQQPAPPQPADQTKPAEQEKPAEPPKYEETLVVTASKTEEKLVNAPATLTVIGSQTIQSSPSQNFADLMRAVPGVNITQVSARDINITSRGATGTLATGQLALLDGRSLYLDFFGFVMWDFLPVNFDEIKQIEVIRGPASAVWGANALNGVVNVITKTPREIQGSSFTLGFGGFDRSVNGSDEDAGALWYVNGTHAQAVNDRWAYKLSAGAYSQDPMPRPTGNIPGTTTPYPPYTNTGTTQPKLDVRVDYDHPDGMQRWTVGGGVAGTEGIMHSGIGPFDINSGSVLGYAKVGYSLRAFRVNFFTNILNGDAANLLARDTRGQPIHFDFGTRTYDVEFGNAVTFVSRHVVSYGANFRYNSFDLSLAPAADSRKEGGFYMQDDIFVHDKFRVVLGGRIDAFDNLPDPVFSPRVAVMIKPSVDQTFRVSYNRAYRSPSVINEYLFAPGILNEADLSAIHPSLRNFIFPISAEGNPDIEEQSLEAYEVGYTAVVAERATLSAAFYVNKLKKDINFAQTATYSSANPPPTLAPPFRPALDLLNRIGRGLPCCFTYINLGDYTQRGFELGADVAVNPNIGAFVNYSWQDEPDPENEADRGELNVPPQHRVNVGLNFNYARFLGNVAVSYSDTAFWQDVLDSRYHGFTDSYALVNAGFGVKWADGRLTTTVKVVNLTNEDVQQHVFGDILKRQVIGEVKVRF